MKKLWKALMRDNDEEKIMTKKEAKKLAKQFGHLVFVEVKTKKETSDIDLSNVQTFPIKPFYNHHVHIIESIYFKKKKDAERVFKYLTFFFEEIGTLTVGEFLDEVHYEDQEGRRVYYGDRIYGWTDLSSMCVIHLSKNKWVITADNPTRVYKTTGSEIERVEIPKVTLKEKPASIDEIKASLTKLVTDMNNAFKNTLEYEKQLKEIDECLKPTKKDA